MSSIVVVLPPGSDNEAVSILQQPVALLIHCPPPQFGRDLRTSFRHDLQATEDAEEVQAQTEAQTD